MLIKKYLTLMIQQQKLSDVENKIPDKNCLMTTTILNTMKLKTKYQMLVSGLITKTDYNAKISDFVGKYLTTSDYNRFIKEMSDPKNKSKRNS